jgi:hypothetical protein
MAHRIMAIGRLSSIGGRCVNGWGMDSGMTLGVSGQGTGSGVLFYSSYRELVWRNTRKRVVGRWLQIHLRLRVRWLPY